MRRSGLPYEVHANRTCFVSGLVGPGRPRTGARSHGRGRRWTRIAATGRTTSPRRAAAKDAPLVCGDDRGESLEVI